MSRTFLMLHRGSVFLIIYFSFCACILIPPIYRETLLQFTEKYYINRTAFHFRRRAEAVWHAFQRRSARLALARLEKGFIRRSEPC